MPKNKKYYTKDGQVNVNKVCKDIEAAREKLMQLHTIVKCERQHEFNNVMMIAMMKLIDVTEDLKGNVNTEMCGN